MARDPRLIVTVLLGAMLGCGKSSEAPSPSGSATNKAPFSISIHSVEVFRDGWTVDDKEAAKVVPRSSWYVCVQFIETNTTEKKEPLVLPWLIDAKGNENPRENSRTYESSGWKNDSISLGDRVEPGQAVRQSSCFDVDKEAVASMQLRFERPTLDPAHPGWTITMPVDVR